MNCNERKNIIHTKTNFEEENVEQKEETRIENVII